MGTDGLGCEVASFEGRRFVSHSGFNVGYQCFMCVEVESGLGICIFSNSEGGAEVISSICPLWSDDILEKR